LRTRLKGVTANGKRVFITNPGNGGRATLTKRTSKRRGGNTQRIKKNLPNIGAGEGHMGRP